MPIGKRLSLEELKTNLAQADAMVAKGMSIKEAMKKLGRQGKSDYYRWKYRIERLTGNASTQTSVGSSLPQTVTLKRKYKLKTMAQDASPIPKAHSSQVCIIMGDGTHITEILNFMKANV